ncbi:HPr kinase/phosphorylase [Methylobacterium dankookense]|uniref:HPr kinase/phosphorylase n=1 Tax=Methylobacterium dankookense TaxID=560405 RepID=A0A564FUP3_9HYPH|nr:hypothetical protein [Methylobacterium dankookense]GJD57556.1 HPr kinase/phosphorylase [Methylobacterium dankookense]VUF11476.1 HPr kinase/phosphorylase [Methylobacterium dankookense]
MPEAACLTAHAACVVLGEAGVLIRGESGAGKSSLALGLIEAASSRGLFAALVADDRVRIARSHGRLVARSHPAIAGRIEVRGLGLLALPALEACLLARVVDLAEAAPRFPEAGAERAEILGIDLPRLCLDRPLRAAGLGPAAVLAALGVASQPHNPIVRSLRGIAP